MIGLSFPLKPIWRNYGFAAVNTILLKTNEHELPSTINLDENCFWKLDLYTGELHWSDGICQLLGFQKNNTPTLEQLIWHDETVQNIRAAFNRAIHQGVPFQLKLPSPVANDKVIMVCTTAVPVYDGYGKCIAVKGTLQTGTQAENYTLTFLIPFEKTDGQQTVLDNFARIVSHDLRSQTVNLQMLIESAEQKKHGGEMQELVNNLKTISQNLNQTVGYLNTLTKI